MLSRRPLGFRTRLCKLNWRQLELKAGKHLVTCNQSDMHRRGKLERHPSELSLRVKFSKLNRSIRLGFRMAELLKMIKSGNIKERQIATLCHSSLAGTSSCSHPFRLSRQSKESSMNKTLCIEQLSSTTRSTGAHQHQSQQIQLSPADNDNQEDAPGSRVAADGDDSDRDSERRCPVIKLDDQRELASEACASLITNKHVGKHWIDRTMALLMQPETDRKECRYNSNPRLPAQRSYVIVRSTWFDDAVLRECHLANYESTNQDSRQRPLTVSLQTIRNQPTASTSEDNYRRFLYSCLQYILSPLTRQCSVRLLPIPTLFLDEQISTRDCVMIHQFSPFFLSFEVVGTPSVASTSPLLSLETTECSVGARAIGAMTSPTLDSVTTARCSETTTVMSTTSIVSMSDEIHQVVKVLSSPATDRKMPVVMKEGCDTEASTSPSLATVVKCRKNQHNNVWYKCVQGCQLCQNCQLTKKLPKKRHKESPTYRQYYSMIRQIHNNVQEIHTSCRSSERECHKILKSMQGLLHQNWIEQFWSQWILQQIGIQISQSEHNATVLLSHAQRPNSMGIKTTCTQNDYSHASEPGNIKSTKLSTESARIQSSSLASAPGLAKSYKEPQGQLPSFIWLQDVIEDTSKEKSIKIKSISPESSNSSSFQNYNYMHRLPAVRMARTKQTARKSRDDRQEEDR